MTVWFAEDFGLTPLRVGITDGAVTAVTFGAGESTPVPDLASLELWERTRDQLRAYFAGSRRIFDLPLRTAGTEFQTLVWEALRRIPYGETVTYGELARAIGRPRAPRAVGMACHANPICVIIPCHRVVGAGGALTGFAGGLEVKRRLLELEQR